MDLQVRLPQLDVLIAKLDEIHRKLDVLTRPAAAPGPVSQLESVASATQTKRRRSPKTSPAPTRPQGRRPRR